MRIAQLSDFHFTRITWNPVRLCSKRLFGNLNWILSRRKVFCEEHLSLLPPLLSELKVDLLLLGGDFTTTATHEEYEVAKKFVSTFKQPWIAIPGNHDTYTYRSFRQRRFYKYLSNQNTPKLEENGVEAHQIASSWWVVALDTCRPTPPSSARGLFPQKTEQNLESLLQKIPSSHSILMLNHYPFFQNDVPQHNLERGEVLEALLSRHPNVRAYLHGHTHRHILADLQKSGLPLILDSGSCAQGTWSSWNLLDLSNEQCTITVYNWKKSWQPVRKETIAWER